MQKIRPDMDIGKNIQSLRYKNNLTQDQVIAKLNLMGIVISKSTYAKLETNRMNIKVSELVAVNTDELVHTARSSSACFPVFQCTLSAA